METKHTGGRRILSAVLALVLCLTMGMSFAFPATADLFVGGDWEKTAITIDGKVSSVNAYVLEKTFRNCSSFLLGANISMNAGARCKNWDIWVRSNGTFSKAGSLYLKDGNGAGYKTVTLSPARNIDAVAVIPTADGGYSWTISLMIMSAVCDSDSTSASGSSNNPSSGSGVPKDRLPAPHPESWSDESVFLEGKWESARIESGNSRINTHAFVFASPLQGIRQITIDLDVEMLYNTKCETWQVWGRVSNGFQRLGIITLPRGDGKVTDTLHFDTPQNISAMAITPVSSGSFSWHLSANFYDAK